MRVIDADELLDRFANVYFCLGGDRPTADLSLTYHSLCNAVKRAPTIEPKSEVFEWCSGCKEYDGEKHCCHRWNSVIRETLKDIERPTLSLKAMTAKERQTIIDGIKKSGINAVLLSDELPARRLTSEWKWEHTSSMETEAVCQNCFYSDNWESNYCPNCGAYMKGGGDL